MKFTKMSLVAALLIGSSAFAIENTKVTGDAKLFYATWQASDTDSTGSERKQDILDQASSAGQAAIDLDITTDLAAGISAGVSATVLTTLGLENNLVGTVWAGNITPNPVMATGNNLQGSNGTAWWVDQAWIAGTAGKTTGKVGRMELDTPLAFTEKWNIAENTFEAFVLINQDIPDTTLVAAYVGGSNGANDTTVQNAQNGATPFTGYTTYNDGAATVGAVLGTNALDAVGGAGAYAAGVVNNSWKPLTAQAWYYNVTNVANAYWLQADLNIEGILVGAQYASMMLEDSVTSVIDGAAHDVAGAAAANNLKLDTTAYALMVGYAMKDVVTVKAAYSSVSDDSILNIQNTATGNQSKLYTEAWWSYGVVGLAGANTIMLSAEATFAEVDFLAQYNNSTIKHKVLNPNNQVNVTEVTLTASKSFGPLDTTLAYIYGDMNKDNALNKATSNMVQAYLTLNF